MVAVCATIEGGACTYTDGIGSSPEVKLTKATSLDDIHIGPVRLGGPTSSDRCVSIAQGQSE